MSKVIIIAIIIVIFIFLFLTPDLEHMDDGEKIVVDATPFTNEYIINNPNWLFVYTGKQNFNQFPNTYKINIDLSNDNDMEYKKSKIVDFIYNIKKSEDNYSKVVLSYDLVNIDSMGTNTGEYFKLALFELVN